LNKPNTNLLIATFS